MSEDEELDDLMDQVKSNVVIVTTPAGAEVKLLTEEEKRHYENLATLYQEHNAFSNISDLQELDRLLTMEIMVYRWTQWLTEERDYENEAVNVADLNKNINDASKEIRLIKKALGIDKATRDRSEETNVAEYISNLRRRAKEFGVMRNKQAVAAITLWKELIGKVDFYEGCDEIERKEFRAQAEDVIHWIRQQDARFNEIDDAFRKEQTLWVREL